MRSYRIPRCYIYSSYTYYINKVDEPSNITLLRERLNNAKNLLNNVYNDNSYQQVSQILDYCRQLRSVIKYKYNAQNVSNSWLKMYEILSYYNLINSNSKYYFANCEMPGSFILAFNHYNTTILSGKMLWYAYSMLPTSKNNYLTDKYKLYKLYPNNWLMDKYNNGDTTLMSNIVDCSIKLLHITNNKLVDLYTSDGATDTSSDYNNQEHIEAKLLLSQILMGLHTISIGANMVIKTFTYLDHMSLTLLLILSSIFDELYVSKPMSSRCINSEVYIICKCYNGCPLWIRSLLSNRLINYNTNPLIDLHHLYNNIEFMDAIYKSYTIFQYQIISLEYNIRIYNKYRNNISYLYNLNKKDIRDAIYKYIANTGIKYISNNNKLRCRDIRF